MDGRSTVTENGPVGEGVAAAWAKNTDNPSTPLFEKTRCDKVRQLLGDTRHTRPPQAPADLVR
jgi:hypothetical protein